MVALNCGGLDRESYLKTALHPVAGAVVQAKVLMETFMIIRNKREFVILIGLLFTSFLKKILLVEPVFFNFFKVSFSSCLDGVGFDQFFCHFPFTVCVVD